MRPALRSALLALSLLPALAQADPKPAPAQPAPAQPASAQPPAPISAIDWLSASVAAPAPSALPQATVRDEPSARPVAAPETITARPLSAVNPDGLGIVGAEASGLRADLWGDTPTAELAGMLRAERADTLPSVQAMLTALLVARLDPPADSDGTGTLLLARIDKLLDLGALDPALALLEEVPEPGPEVFRRWFDVALLLGQETEACRAMARNVDMAPTLTARIFCLARLGDWKAANTLFTSARALGQIEAEEADLLARFLDDASTDEQGPPPPPGAIRITPLTLRMREAIGEALPTDRLPLAFAHADLSETTGWKARLEAGERLARVGALAPNQLLGLYTEQRPSASGGVWERAAAVQALEGALELGDPLTLGPALTDAWALMEEAELEVPFAEMVAERLPDSLPGPAGAAAFRIRLLGPSSSAAAAARTPLDETEAFLIGLARGNVARILQPSQLGAAIRIGFDPMEPLRDDYVALIEGNRRGEALLRAIGDVTDGAKGDLRKVTSGLQLFRHLGMEALARRTALELMILPRNG